MALLEIWEAYHSAARCLVHGTCRWCQVCSKCSLVDVEGPRPCGDHSGNDPSQTVESNIGYHLKGSQSQYRVRALTLCISVDLEILLVIYFKEMITSRIRFSYKTIIVALFINAKYLKHANGAKYTWYSHIMGCYGIFKRVIFWAWGRPLLAFTEHFLCTRFNLKCFSPQTTLWGNCHCLYFPKEALKWWITCWVTRSWWVA